MTGAVTTQTIRSSDTNPTTDIFETLSKKIDHISTLAAFLPPLGQTPKLNAALAKSQAEFPPIPKRRIATVIMKDNKGKYTFNYADLADIISVTAPVLGKNGLSTSSIIETQRQGGGLILTVFLRHESGEEISSALPLPPHQGRPQDLGSLLTYYKRYLLSGLIGISSEEDDDGSRGGGDVATVKAKEPNTKTKESSGPAPKNGPTPKPAPAKAGRSKDDYKRLNEKMTRHQWTVDDGKAFLNAAYNVAGSNDLTKDQFEEFLNVIETMGPGQAIEIARENGAEKV